MPPVRVMVVDDSVAVRRLVRDSLSPCPDITVVATAGNGTSALAQIPDCAPDVVVLDVDMPVMDGMMTLRQIHSRWPELPVVMFTGLVRNGATAAEAMAAGAIGCVSKPSQLRDRSHALAATRERLEPLLRRPSGKARPVRVAVGPAASAPEPCEPCLPPAETVPVHDPRPPRVLLIGSSTGGPDALARLVPALPADLAVPVLVVQHMPPVFTRSLAKRLDGMSTLAVVEAEDGMPARPGRVHIAPGGLHLTVHQENGKAVLRLDGGPLVNSCRPSVDVLLHAAASVWGSRTLTVMLTGMGHDGLDGTRELRGLGGRVFAQDAATSVVWGMPGAVCQAGLVDRTLPIDELAAAIREAFAATSPRQDQEFARFLSAGGRYGR